MQQTWQMKTFESRPSPQATSKITSINLFWILRYWQSQQWWHQWSTRQEMHSEGWNSAKYVQQMSTLVGKLLQPTPLCHINLPVHSKYTILNANFKMSTWWPFWISDCAQNWCRTAYPEIVFGVQTSKFRSTRTHFGVQFGILHDFQILGTQNCVYNAWNWVYNDLKMCTFYPGTTQVSSSVMMGRLPTMPPKNKILFCIFVRNAKFKMSTWGHIERADCAQNRRGTSPICPQNIKLFWKSILQLTHSLPDFSRRHHLHTFSQI
jgi:hypothetical protein